MRLAACGVRRGVCRAKTLALAPQHRPRAPRGWGMGGECVALLQFRRTRFFDFEFQLLTERVINTSRATRLTRAIPRHPPSTCTWVGWGCSGLDCAARAPPQP